MTRVRKPIRWLLPAVALLLFALVSTGVPVHAAEGGEDAATTGETEASVSFTAGKLKLDSVPVLDFGQHPISPEAQEYEAVSMAPNVQVSDLRGSGGGWDLLVSLSAFQMQEGGSATLKAASIHFTAPTVSAVNGTIGTPPSAVSDITLTSDDTETPVLTADSGEGMGLWGLGWNTSDVTLAVKPGTAQEGTSVAVLTWSLQSTP